MRGSGIVVLLLSVLFCCSLSGCADFIKSEEMDKEVVNFIEALNEDDADRIFQSMYPDVVTREEFDESYEAVRKLWEKSDEYTTKLNSINTRKNYTQSGDFRICQAQYYVYTQAQDYTITFTYRSDDTGDGGVPVQSQCWRGTCADQRRFYNCQGEFRVSMGVAGV